jgi:MFS family permease
LKIAVKMPPGRLGALGERPFRLLWLGQTLSALGDGFVPLALAFAVLSQLDGSAADLGLVLASATLAQVVFMLVGGVWADRLPRRAVMLVADVARGLVHAGIAVDLLAGTAEPWHLAIGAAVSGVATSFFNPASTGLIPETVSVARLQEANALMGLSRSTIRIFAPAVSGLLVAGFGPGWAFALNALSYVASIASLAALPLVSAVRQKRRAFVRELAEGWSEVRSRTWVWTALVCLSLANISVAFFFVLGPLVVEQELGGPTDWGIALTGGAVGGVLGGVLAIRLRPLHPLRWAFAPILLCAAQLLALVPPLPALGLAVGAALAGGGIALSSALWNTVLQERIPRHALSRVSAYDWLVSLVFAPIGYVLAGPLAERIGVDATLVIAAGLCAAAGLGMLLVPEVRSLQRLSAEPELQPQPLLATSSEPAPGGAARLIPSR